MQTNLYISAIKTQDNINKICSTSTIRHPLYMIFLCFFLCFLLFWLQTLLRLFFALFHTLLVSEPQASLGSHLLLIGAQRIQTQEICLQPQRCRFPQGAGYTHHSLV